jgi:hypothetical protein
MRCPCSLYVCTTPPFQLLNAWTNLYMKLGMHVMAPESISTAYFLNPSHESVYVYLYRPMHSSVILTYLLTELSPSWEAAVFLTNFCNELIFYGEELLTPLPTPKLGDHPLSVARDCLFNIFSATLHIWRPSPPSATWGRAMPWLQGPVASVVYKKEN